MPAFDSDSETSASGSPLTQLPFPPVTKAHILHCSYHYWYGLYRSISPKARLIPLPPAFINYLRADGIILPPEETATCDNDDTADDSLSVTSVESDPADKDPSEEWRDVHIAIQNTINELGGKIVPKLNWSSPKDATWINATNSMECRSANDVYLLLKSSDFITHDLEQAFVDCVGDLPQRKSEDSQTSPIPYHLVLRKYFAIIPSMEFRCFVRSRGLLCLCQRDLNHYDFLDALRPTIVSRIEDFFQDKLRDSFPDDNFVFDVYIPAPHKKVWLIDINPWAPRTDPLLFSWLEILNMKSAYSSVCTTTSDGSGKVEEIDEEFNALPELRLVKKDDPEAYNFNTSQYSAHKLPKDVVDAASGATEGGLKGFLSNWKDILEKRFREEAEEEEEEAV